RVLGRRAEAEDAVQEACLRALDALTAGRYDARLRMEAWLVTIVIRVALDMVRTQRVRARTLAPTDPAEVSWPGATEERHRARIGLERGPARLAFEQGGAVVLKYLEGFTSAEVGIALGVSGGAIEQRIPRARAILKERLRDDRPGESRRALRA